MGHRPLGRDTRRLRPQITDALRATSCAAAGFGAAESISERAETAFRTWLAVGNHADMAYLERHAVLRLHPQSVLPGVRTVISLAFRFPRPEQPGPVAAYALGRNYHKAINSAVKPLVVTLRQLGATARVAIDSAPIAERYWAVRSGIATPGRNGMALVSGCGPIGLMAIGACKVHGAKQIIACDMFDEKLELAKVMGADIIINSGKESVIDAVRQATDGSGADAAIDITGNGKAIVDGIRALRKAGIMVSVGLPDGEIPINLTEDIIYREVTYTGISGRRMFETWEDCMQIIQTPGFSLEPAIGGVYPLSVL